MALPLPSTSKEITQRAQVDVRREAPQSNPTLRRGYLRALLIGICNRVFEFYLALADVALEGNPLTAIRNLDRWASVWKIFTLPGAPASGFLWLDANIFASTVVIANGTRFVSTEGTIYLASADVGMGYATGSISALTASGGTATATATAHGLASNAVVSVLSAGVAGFNLSGVPIHVVDVNHFTYAVDPSLSGAAGGSPTWLAYGARVPVVSEGTGADKGQDQDAPLAFESSPPANVSSPGQVCAPGLIDGADVEGADAKRARMLFRIRNPVAMFNKAAIESKAREIGGVTRVFVQEVTPAVGQVTVYFMRDGDLSPIPSAGEVATVKAKILEIKPAEMSANDVIVAAPTAVPTDFTFSAISPSTASMKAAVRETLAEFFKLKTSVGVSVPQDAYRSAIFNTRDPVTGDPVASFTLSAPSGAITIASGQIATLGTVTI